MNCSEYNESIMKFFEGSLNDIENAQLKQHLKACKKCSSEFDDMETIFSSLESMEQIEPPQDFEIQVMDKIKAISPGYKEIPEKTVKFIYGFTSFLLVLLLFMFTINIAGSGVFESLATRFHAVGSIIDFVGTISDLAASMFSFVSDLAFSIAKVMLLLAKTYYYIIILVAVMLFAIQWMYISFLRQLRGGQTR